MKHLRSIVTFAAIAVPGVLVATTTFLTPLTPGTLDRSPEQVRMPTADTRVICPGPLLVEQAAEGTDAQFVDDSNVSTRVVSASAPISAVDGSVSAAGLRVANLGAAPRFDNPVSGGFVSGDDEVNRTTIVTGFARPGAPALTSAVETIEGTSGDLTGLATLTCAPASSRLSVLAGSGRIGSNSQLLLSNPGDIPVQASITVMTPSGVRTAPTELSIRAGSQRGVRLGGLAPGAEALAVEVSVRGGVLSGSVQETRLSGLTPQGIDLASGGAKAAGQQVITGLSGKRVRLRIAAPGGLPAEVGIRAYGSDGEISVPRSRMTVVAHGVAEVDLGDLDGASLVLDSSEDIAAAASVSKDLEGSGRFRQHSRNGFAGGLADPRPPARRHRHALPLARSRPGRGAGHARRRIPHRGSECRSQPDRHHRAQPGPALCLGSACGRPERSQRPRQPVRERPCQCDRRCAHRDLRRRSGTGSGRCRLPGCPPRLRPPRPRPRGPGLGRTSAHTEPRRMSTWSAMTAEMSAGRASRELWYSMTRR